MDTEKWKVNVKEVLFWIASKQYQEKSWFRKGEFVSSPEELYCNLFDDRLYEEFLDSSKVGLTAHQKTLGRLLKDKMDQFSPTMGDYPDPKTIINHPQWEEIREAAQVFLDSL